MRDWANIAGRGRSSRNRCYEISRPLAELSDQCPKTAASSATPLPNFAPFFQTSLSAVGCSEKINRPKTSGMRGAATHLATPDARRAHAENLAGREKNP